MAFSGTKVHQLSCIIILLKVWLAITNKILDYDPGVVITVINIIYMWAKMGDFPVANNVKFQEPVLLY